MKAPGAALLVLFLASPVLAETGTVTGQVFEKGSKNAVPTAEVMLLRTKFHAWTGLDGRFVLKEVPTGYYELTAVGGGFLPSSTQTIRVISTHTVEVTVLLEKPFFTGQEIVVKGERIKSVGQQGLTREEMKKIPGTFDDPLRGLQALPGVISPSDFATTFALAGSDDYDNITLIDNVPIDLPFHLGGLVSTIHPDAIKSADLYTAGFGPKYGNATGGAMEVATREPRRDRFAADLNFNPILPDGMLDIPLPHDGGLMVAGRRSYFDLLLHHIKDLTVVPTFQDGIVKLSYDLSDRGVLSFETLGATDGFAVNSSNEDTSFFKKYLREIADWKWYWTQSDAVKTDLTFYHGSDSLLSNDVNYSSPGPDQINNAGLSSELWGARAQMDIEWDPRVKTMLGGVYENSRLDGTAIYQNYIDPLNQQNGVNLSNDSLAGDFQTLSAYAEQKFQIFEPLWVSIGGRVDQRRSSFNEYDTGVATITEAGVRTETHYSPRASFELTLGEKTKLRGAWGQYYQWPSLDTPPFDALSNINLRAESARHYVIGVERDLPADVFGSLQGFYKTMSNLIVDPNPDPNNLNQHNFVIGQPVLQNSGTGWSKGGELLIRKKVGGRFVGWGSYTYEVSRRTLAPGQGQIPATYDQNNILTLLGSYQFSRRWEFSARWNSHTGNPYTPLLYVTDVNNNNQGVYAPLDSGRLPSYQRLDLRLTKTVSYKSWTIAYYFDLINATNHKNVLDIRYFSGSNNGGNAQINPNVDTQFPLIPFFGIRAQY
jgi:hypothetical protein